MAHKKGVGSSKNGRESHSKRLGVKIWGGQACIAGNNSEGNMLTGDVLSGTPPVFYAPSVGKNYGRSATTNPAAHARDYEI